MILADACNHRRKMWTGLLWQRGQMNVSAHLRCPLQVHKEVRLRLRPTRLIFGAGFTQTDGFRILLAHEYMAGEMRIVLMRDQQLVESEPSLLYA